MKKSLFLSRIALVLLILVCSRPFARASHVVGMDLNYRNISGDTYQVTLILYSNCGEASLVAASTMPHGVPKVYIYDHGALVTSIDLAIVPPDSGIEVTPICSDSTQCVNTAYAIPGVKRFTYTGTYTVPSHSACWRFLYTGEMASAATSERAADITNLTPPGVTIVQITDTLNDLIAPNSSPYFTNIATPFFTDNAVNSYNPGAIDPDGDSLSFSFGPAQNGSAAAGLGSVASYISPYSYLNPLGVPSNTTYVTLDSTNGQITFYPIAQYRNVVFYNIREYRAGQLVGSSQREMTFTTLISASAPPTIFYDSATAGTITAPYVFHVSSGTGPYSIFMNPFSTTTTNPITVSDTALPAGATFTTIGNGTPAPACTFSWTTAGVTPGTYTFYVTLASLGSSTCNTEYFTFVVIVDPAVPTGIATQTVADFTIAPNPATDIIRITAPVLIRNIALSDLSGRLLLAATGSSRSETLHTASLPAGVYQVRINDGSQSKMFIKK
jgi:Secretion system C-terminal sorting domain